MKLCMNVSYGLSMADKYLDLDWPQFVAAADIFKGNSDDNLVKKSLIPHTKITKNKQPPKKLQNIIKQVGGCRRLPFRRYI